MNEATPPWWERRWVQALLICSAAIPLLYPAIPPLIDTPGHMGRYAVELAQGSPSPLHAFYRFDWQFIGNLGGDLLILPMARLFGLELAVKLIALSIPVLTAFGLLWISREAHGRVSPTVLIALPLVYGYHFVFGFLNYSLSMALSLVAGALWLSLGRLGRVGLRSALFLCIAPLIWLTHVFGWAVLCVVCGMTESIRQYDSRERWAPAIGHAVANCLPLAPPFILLVAWRTGKVGGSTDGWFEPAEKARWIAFILRDRWLGFDLASAAVIYGAMLTLAWLVFVRRSAFTYSRALLAAGLALLAFYLILPLNLLGSAYADMRLLPFACMVLILSVGIRPGVQAASQQTAARLGLIFLVTRLAAVTASFVIAAQAYERALPALDHLPRGAKLVSFVGTTCSHTEGVSKLLHLPSLAIVRRSAFSNDQWALEGAQLLQAVYPGGSDAERYFRGDPSQIVTREPCAGGGLKTIDWSIAHFPRDKFDYVWLIDAPNPDSRLMQGLTPVWSNGANALYRVEDRRLPALEAPTGAGAVASVPALR